MSFLPISDDIESQLAPSPSSPQSPPEFLWDVFMGPRLNETADIQQYKAVMRGCSHPRALRRFYEQNSVLLFKPMSSNMDTPFHAAAFLGDTRLLKILLRIAASHEKDEFIFISERICDMSNNYGNNILHEVAATGNVKVLELLTERIDVQNRAFLEPEQIKKLVSEKNVDGETPIFKASALAGKKVLQCMVEKVADSSKGPPDTAGSSPAPPLPGSWVRQMIGQPKEASHRRRPSRGQLHLSPDHLHNLKGRTIIEIAILGQHFDSALWLLDKGNLDNIFTTEEDKKADIKCLDLLARMPHAFKSGYKMGIWHGLIYTFLPVDIMEYAYQWQYGILWVYYAFWLFIAKVIWAANRVWAKKRTHSQAVKLLNRVLQKGVTWMNVLSPAESGGNPNISPSNYKQFVQNSDLDPSHHTKYILDRNDLNPLLLAASNGIEEIVSTILDRLPIAIGSTNNKGWNLLHVAVAFRQTDIFRLLTEEWELPLKRLATSVVTDSKYTVLHQVSDTELCSDYNQGMHYGPALHLQDELRWYQDVEEITPNTILFNQDSNTLTAIELFTEKHKELHKTATGWLKDASVNCSTVAVLIAGVAFAGACTVPGDYHDDGYPNLRSATLYKVFTAADVVALTSSLISVVVFLSILTLPLSMKSFGHSLPKKLFWGFATLFVSVTATMLAFMAAVMLVIRMKHKDWRTSLAYATVFLPVPIMGIIQIPLAYIFERLVAPAFAKALRTTQSCATSFIVSFQNIADTCRGLFNKKTN